MIEALKRLEVQQFIRDNEFADPFELSLKHKELFGLPTQIVANQIAARKKAKSKLPEWYQTPGILYPPLLSMEQCSSETTAIHKQQIIQGETLIDLTGGTGVDTFYLSKVFKNVTYVERSETLCEIAKHNFKILGAENIRVVNTESEEFIKSYDKKVSAIFIDPARRSDANQKVFLWSDCEPSIIDLQPALLEKTSQVLIKASPMLDISSGSEGLSNLDTIHIVSVKNECKEVLYGLTNGGSETNIKTINYGGSAPDVFSFTANEEANANISYKKPQRYLYEPNTSILKAGAFKLISHKLGVQKLHQNSHLYTSETLVENFPGRMFSINHVVKYSKKEVLRHLPSKKANITVRNFPEEVEGIRKKLKVTPGGDIYLFATTLIDDQKAIIICHKAK